MGNIIFSRAIQTFEKMKLLCEKQNCFFLNINSRPYSENSELHVEDVWTQYLTRHDQEKNINMESIPVPSTSGIYILQIGRKNDENTYFFPSPSANFF